MATIKITEKAIANELKPDAYFLVTQTENGVVSLRRVPLAVVMAGVEGIIAAPYSSSAHYEVGDYCIHDGQLQQCKTPIKGETWNASHWTVVTVIESLEAEAFDNSISFGLLLNYIRQNEDAWNAKGFTARHGTVTLTNTQAFPFNDSKQTVALSPALPDTTYAVITQITSAAGPAGEVEVSDKLVNGFKLNTTGSASSVVVDYIVIGGFAA